MRSVGFGNRRRSRSFAAAGCVLQKARLSAAGASRPTVGTLGPMSVTELAAAGMAIHGHRRPSGCLRAKSVGKDPLREELGLWCCDPSGQSSSLLRRAHLWHGLPGSRGGLVAPRVAARQDAFHAVPSASIRESPNPSGALFEWAHTKAERHRLRVTGAPARIARGISATSSTTARRRAKS